MHLRFMSSKGLLIALMWLGIGVGCAGDLPHAQFTPPWVRFVQSSKAAGAYDSASLRFHGDTAEIWLRFREAAPTPMPNDSTRLYHIVQAAAYVHCPSGRVRDIRSYLAGPSADSLGGHTPEAPEWMAFAEHGLSLMIFDALCDALADKIPRSGA